MTTIHPKSGTHDGDVRKAVFQKRLDEQEKMYNDGKRVLQSEIERLKFDLARSQKANADLNNRLESQKKQIATQDHRIDELRRAALADKAEIKDLGVKLRLSEHQRSQIAAKQGDVTDLKKAMSSLEMKRRDEVKEKDRAISDLEKALVSEKKRRESVEINVKNTKAKSDAEVAEVKDAIKSLQVQLFRALDDARGAEKQAEDLKRNAADHENMLLQVTELYGTLSRTTVSKGVYERLRFQHAALQIQVNRLSRKLANSEGQVAELARLVRQGQEQQVSLRKALLSAEEEISFYHSAADSNRSSYTDSSLHDVFIDTLFEAQASERQDKLFVLQFMADQATFLNLELDELLSAYSVAQGELDDVTVARDTLEIQVQETRQERDTTKDLLLASTQTANTLKASSEILRRQVAELESKLEKEKNDHEAVFKKERDAVQRLTTTVQKERMAEEGLRSEIEELTAELMKAAQFEEAYYSLSEEVESLVARNALAEDEAQKLSRFNAEILGHNNPAQRIMYVERIRNELASSKQKLIASTRAHEAATTTNHELQQELDMYKSVMVPHDNKPKTNMTRVMRPPLTNINQSS
ncbi:hypothetical protein K435DRAFT_129857 [Dendrothele bispora CBS 962.96]|uniref:Hyaluronan-mediated motility receptor C-terminal domain-containing protein n=1 Tax=Dendrothele bispora (strain CBS 962.96) TaxID=1314807 RepID=A0A4S8M0L9_DENBC|nr:hypothetical protein K435DRAFT_129857 [Dendrothele bispora CBS 962.96]